MRSQPSYLARNAVYHPHLVPLALESPSYDEIVPLAGGGRCRSPVQRTSGLHHNRKGIEILPISGLQARWRLNYNQSASCRPEGNQNATNHGLGTVGREGACYELWVIEARGPGAPMRATSGGTSGSTRGNFRSGRQGPAKVYK